MTARYNALQEAYKAADFKGKNNRIEQLTAEVSKLTSERDELSVVIEKLNVCDILMMPTKERTRYLPYNVIAIVAFSNDFYRPIARSSRRINTNSRSKK